VSDGERRTGKNLPRQPWSPCPCPAPRRAPARDQRDPRRRGRGEPIFGAFDIARLNGHDLRDRPSHCYSSSTSRPEVWTCSGRRVSTISKASPASGQAGVRDGRGDSEPGEGQQLALLEGGWAARTIRAARYDQGGSPVQRRRSVHLQCTWPTGVPPEPRARLGLADCFGGWCSRRSAASPETRRAPIHAEPMPYPVLATPRHGRMAIWVARRQ
jgi:hypothetical protein